MPKIEIKNPLKPKLLTKYPTIRPMVSPLKKIAKGIKKTPTLKKDDTVNTNNKRRLFIKEFRNTILLLKLMKDMLLK